MKKKATKSQKRSRKGAVKDLEPKANPKGGHTNFTSQAVLGDGSVRTTPVLPGALKIEYLK